MDVFYRLSQLKQYPKPVVAIGVFDGLHRAHRQIIRYALRRSRQKGGTALVITFYPHPRGKESIYSLAHRLKLIEELGVKVCVVIRFTKAFARMKANDFIEKIIIKKIRAEAVCVGEDFRFGRNAGGNVALLRAYARQGRYTLKVFDVIKVFGRGVSSTFIRSLILSGKLPEAKQLLIHPVSVFGRIVRGSGVATKLGFPTANVSPHHEIIPPAGIYAVKILWQNTLFNGICYIGRKPTFQLNTENSLHVEVHIFGFSRDIYGEYLEVQFFKKIRNEKKFSSPQALSRQIIRDIDQVKALFALH
ncbi:MAG: riboflavin biosynthesis protein RibF [Candidatus Omnitrophota bacterium]|jgi:riboflavin kinase/FMN adenylyltransferase